MFEGFTHHKVKTTGAEINFRSAGRGPPLLLLHGYPQTHAMWHKIAPDLARRVTVVAADLRGYGDSSKPDSDTGHTVYSTRAMALDMMELMASLGFRRFAVAGHDRGARARYRPALDHPEAISKLVVLDRRSSDPLAAWRPWTQDVRGQAIADCGHFLPEEAPLETRKAMEEFL